MLRGLHAGRDSFLLNTVAALGIVGPALLISNVVVKALQDARGRAQAPFQKIQAIA